jgi:hypothetical protein
MDANAAIGRGVTILIGGHWLRIIGGYVTVLPSIFRVFPHFETGNMSCIGESSAYIA